MPKQSDSDIEIVGDVSWSKLMQQCAPQSLPSTDEMRRKGWKTCSDLMAMWERSETNTKQWCKKMVASGIMEQRKSKKGCNIISIYRPKTPKR